MQLIQEHAAVSELSMAEIYTGQKGCVFTNFEETEYKQRHENKRLSSKKNAGSHHLIHLLEEPHSAYHHERNDKVLKQRRDAARPPL